MQRRNIFILLATTGLVMTVGVGLWLATAAPASAQCGSQASSCKSCHEVQAEMPVNNDGTAWHVSHAFGDFCYICHAGNNQAKGEAEAHTGMVPPLSDIKASCQQCHPADLQERAQVYAAALGVEIGEAGAPAGEPTPAASEAPASQTAVSAPVTTVIDVDDPNLVDYVKNYDEIVLGKKPVNVGNAILLGMIGLVVVGGGGFVITREKLVKVSFGDTRKVEAGYPADVIELLPAIASLKPGSRKSLKNALKNPKKAEKILGLMEAVVSDEKNGE
jgi:hypothetical protein